MGPGNRGEMIEAKIIQSPTIQYVQDQFLDHAFSYLHVFDGSNEIKNITTRTTLMHFLTTLAALQTLLHESENRHWSIFI